VKITSVEQLRGTDREVHCPRGGFISTRLLLKSDGMGFAFTHTFIPKGDPQRWHYLHHLEACYCVSGYGVLRDLASDELHKIIPGTLYALDKNDNHEFEALEDTVLLCVFNPPLEGREVHGADGSYAAAKKEEPPTGAAILDYLVSRFGSVSAVNALVAQYRARGSSDYMATCWELYQQEKLREASK
jgi:L-ectoine synthase